ncbi:hypothetical protein FPHYL_621 [Fusarium phyllophilum]|uniref:Uncharacterized protein n=1 Tax=Fusarium phyllophilum TaxID=47803 RepID=A0A8H5KDG8_9HYPO|nr:hypothetical protein FPHYL_621 [Fusarium phyllophilum]
MQDYENTCLDLASRKSPDCSIGEPPTGRTNPVPQDVKVDQDSPFDYQLPKTSSEQLKRIIHRLFDHPNTFTFHDCQRASAGCM